MNILLETLHNIRREEYEISDLSEIPPDFFNEVKKHTAELIRKITDEKTPEKRDYLLIELDNIHYALEQIVAKRADKMFLLAQNKRAENNVLLPFERPVFDTLVKWYENYLSEVVVK